MTDLAQLSLVELRNAILRGEATSAQAVAAAVERIERFDGAIGSFLSLDEDAVERAGRIDEELQAGKTPGLLAGVPVAVKDNICRKDRPTTCASRMLANFRPPYDATVVQSLERERSVIVGATNLDEFAMGSSTENSAVRATRNPWDPTRIPGGSSGGSAAAVAARFVPLALGSDTGGSIRQPAAHCGVVGFKPTYGRVSRYGLVAFASSLDQVGVFTRTVTDAAVGLQAIAGPDPRDATCSPDAPSDYLTDLDEPLDGLRIGVVEERLAEGLDEELRATFDASIAALQDRGAKIVRVSLPRQKYGIAAYYVISSSEASSNLGRYDGVRYGFRADERETFEHLAEERKELEATGDAKKLDALDSALVRMYRETRSQGFGTEVKRRIMLGTFALSAGYFDQYYMQAAKVRRLIRQDYEQAFANCDLLAGPVTPTAAFKIGERVDDPLAMYLSDLYTVGANLSGVPALSVPAGFTKSGLPVGLHLEAPWFAEARLLQAARAFETTTDAATKSPSDEALAALAAASS
jgi:aspartyl-tRNA(Asn)/glutamyl-tRNA(Gln) amidotransferase subunit A